MEMEGALLIQQKHFLKEEQCGYYFHLFFPPALYDWRIDSLSLNTLHIAYIPPYYLHVFSVQATAIGNINISFSSFSIKCVVMVSEI